MFEMPKISIAFKLYFALMQLRRHDIEHNDTCPNDILHDGVLLILAHLSLLMNYFVTCHIVDRNYIEYYSARCHSVRCHSAKWHSAKCLSNICHPPVCHSIKI
jgi:hypothetical protein